MLSKNEAEHSNPIRLRNLCFEIASQEEVLDLFPIDLFLKKVWWSHIDEVKGAIGNEDETSAEEW